MKKNKIFYKINNNITRIENYEKDYINLNSFYNIGDVIDCIFVLDKWYINYNYNKNNKLYNIPKSISNNYNLLINTKEIKSPIKPLFKINNNYSFKKINII